MCWAPGLHFTTLRRNRRSTTASGEASQQHKGSAAGERSTKIPAGPSSVPTVVGTGGDPPHSRLPRDQLCTAAPHCLQGGLRATRIPTLLLPTAKTSSLTPPHSPLSDCQPLGAGCPCVTPIPTQATWELSREGHRHSRPWRQTLCGGSSRLSFKASPPGTLMPISEPASLLRGAPAYGTQQRGGAGRKGKAKGAQSCSPVTRTASLPRPRERLSLVVMSFPSSELPLLLG